MKTATSYLLLFLAASISCSAYAHPGASSSIEHYSHQIEHNPTDQTAHIQRGIAYSSDGQYDLALADFEQAKKLGSPGLVSFDLGVLHYRRREFVTARAYFDDYLATYPNHIGCIEYRARLLRDMGLQEASVADFKRVFELQEHPNPGHYVSVARMLDATGPQGTEEALSILDGGIAKVGLTPQLQNEAIALERKRGRTDLAIARLETLEPMLGDSPVWKVDMAELKHLNGDEVAASALLQEAQSQLGKLRKTPARETLKVRITEMQAVDTR